MVKFPSATSAYLRRSTLVLLACTLLVAVQEPAAARRHHHGYASHRARVVVALHRFRPVRARFAHSHAPRFGGYVPPFSAYAVDGNTGRVLYARDENAPRHPASITKVMTLYLLFDQIEKGHLSLDSRIEISPHAAAQAPTKLGLRPGSTIRVEDAIKAIVTKSANDMAVAIAERIGGDEETFARMMTRRARALGMNRTVFVNASGLPDDRQITTARDLAVLGRAIHDRFPRYFHFFSTPSFRYAGQFMANHNHLMEQVEGMDGIKTGYTRSSGFNLLSSVNRNGHWLVSVVLGGRTRLGRDRIMADLIESSINRCATQRTTPMVAENPALERGEPQRVAEAVPVVSNERDEAPPVEDVPADEAAAEEEPIGLHKGLAPNDRVAVQSEEAVEPRPAPEAKVPVKTVPAVSVAALDAPLPTSVRPRPAFVSGLPKNVEKDMTATGSIPTRDQRFDGSTSRYIGVATTTPPALKRRPQRTRVEAEKPAVRPVHVASLSTDSEAEAAPRAPVGRPSASRLGTMIQIGATPSLEQANALIAKARSEGRGTLARARPFTEKVQKGGATLYRARFAGLEADAAEAACKSLKRAGMACFTTRN